MEVGPNVFMRRFRVWRTFRFDQNVGLIIGERGAVVVDTRASHRLAARALSELRRITSKPVVAVVNTHHHWDHTWGNALFKPAPIWGHVNCARRFVERHEPHRQRMMAHEPGMADEFSEVVLTPPDRTLVRRATLDLGDRVLLLRHPGRAHTDNDVIVDVPDARVTFAGDLVVADTMPGFGDAFPVSWSRVLGGLVHDVAGSSVVPGHGGALGALDVRARRDQMVELVSLARAVMRQQLGEPEAIRRSPFTREPTRTALARIRAELGAQPRSRPS